MVGTWPEHLKDGTIFLHDDSINVYMNVVIFSAFLWTTAYLLVPVVLGMLSKEYQSRDARGRWSIDNEAVAMLHNICSVYVTVNAALYTCGESDPNPVNDTDWTVLRFFDSPTCRHQVREPFVVSLVFTLTFFVVDSIAMLLKRRHKKKDEAELYLHHAFAGSCIAMSLYCGFGTIAGANMCLMSELSSIFLKICYMFPKDQQTHPLCMTSFLIFLICFTILRVLMYPALLVFAFIDTAKMWEIRSYYRSQVMWPNMGLYVGLNFM